MTMENTIIKSKQEVGFTMTTNIVETLPWIDYREVFTKLEERGRTEGKAEGKAEKQLEIARNLRNMGLGDDQIAQALNLSVDDVKGYLNN
jgi:predicted transposase/invertase (TIGR01784 family)